ncbi:MAG: two-component system chemotaxis family response regulator CheB [Halothiobacillaceae bacterium]|nr:MAG: two-component system chemotaxis family response regulator CheB [Halothiobacillaceae bacterium]
MSKIKVLLVDDSAVIRQVLTAILSSDPAIEVMAAVADPIFAMNRMETQWPDVIVLDVEMPRMDGITFLRKIMSEHPTPVVMCSTLTEKGAETTMQAMAAGAVEIITKPKIGAKNHLTEEAAVLIGSVKAAAKSRVRRLISTPLGKSSEEMVLAKTTLVAERGNVALTKTSHGIVAIGTSTGGTQALEEILTVLPRVSPGIVVVQHMPEKFTAAFAARLNGICEVEVVEAKNQDTVIPGRVLIAPGGKHMQLNRPLVNRHRPSVDVLFRSVAKVAGRNALGIIMTGMGDDGASGLKEMHDSGAFTIAQDEATCVVYGMPKEAVKKGGVDISLPLKEIPREIQKFGLKHDLNARVV